MTPEMTGLHQRLLECWRLAEDYAAVSRTLRAIDTSDDARARFAKLSAVIDELQDEYIRIAAWVDNNQKTIDDFCREEAERLDQIQERCRRYGIPEIMS